MFCSFLDVEENFGVSNDGVVYAVYAYQATRKDELSFEYGERLTVVRRGDVNETEWWWARDTQNNFGYIPRNLLGVSFVIISKKKVMKLAISVELQMNYIFSLFFAFSCILQLPQTSSSMKTT